MELMDAIKARKSSRSFLDKEIPDTVIDEMLEAARLSPSGGNGQSYRFGVIRDANLKKELAHAAGEQMWIAEAPVVIACCAEISWDLLGLPEDDFGLIVNKLRFSEEFIEYLNQYPNRKSVKTLLANPTPLIPAEHMYLVAVTHGLSACFIGFLDVEKANRILRLPENMVCLFLLPVGYPSENTAPREKKSAKEISFCDAWQK